MVRDAHLGWTLYPRLLGKKKLNRKRHPNPGPEELQALASADISSTENSKVGVGATALERRLLARGVRAPVADP